MLSSGVKKIPKKISHQKFDLAEDSETSSNPVIECAEESSDIDGLCGDDSSGDEWLVVCLRML